ncbi:MAG TPA: GGDEF domain-containing protein [Gemmatimonadales bacterium]|nr:GGDEF domain-containing protein [Gemmatimonadales bacterium]
MPRAAPPQTQEVYANLWRIVSRGLPEVPIILAAIVYTQAQWLQSLLAPLAPFYPYAVFGAGVLIGWRFHRSRLLFALLLLAIADRTLVFFAVGHGLARDRVILQAIGVLLPLNLAALPLTSERGFITPPGLARLALILGQVVFVSFLDREAPGTAAALLHTQLLPKWLFNWTSLADPALLAFLMAGGLVLAAQLMAPTSTGRSFAWALLPIFLGLSVVRPGNPGFSTFYLATGALILIVAVVEASYHMAYQDSLTGLPARRALNEALLRIGGQYSVAMLDVDHFKRINDRHGHDVGDQVLKMIAAKLAQVGGGGKAYRYGGEEFAVIFPGCGAEQCVPDLEALRQLVEDTRFILRSRFRSKKKKEKVLTDRGPGERVPVTISIGVAEKTDRHTKWEQVVKAADRALYRAKEGGRNQVKD